MSETLSGARVSLRSDKWMQTDGLNRCRRGPHGCEEE